MKKWISLLCVCVLIFGSLTASVVSASAEDVEKGVNAVDVKKGDEVTYIFSLDKASEPVVGSDFSFYYDSSVFKIDSVADFNDNTDSEDWTAVINTNLDGEVRGVWSILKGVDFSKKRHFITLNLKAIDDAQNTHITYRIRFLYGNKAFDQDNPKINLENYEFTAEVLVNGEVVIDAPPEWNDQMPEENGKFIPSLDGKSEHADSSIAGVVDKAKNNSNAKAENVENKADNNGYSNNGAANNDAANNAVNGGSVQNNAGDNEAAGANGSKNGSANAEVVPVATTAEGYYVLATDANGNVTATSDQPPVAASADGKKGGSPILWIIIALVVIAGGGAAVYFFMKKKPADNAAAATAAASTGAADAPADASEALTPVTEPAEAEVPEENVAEVVEAESPASEENTQSADDSTESEG